MAYYGRFGVLPRRGGREAHHSLIRFLAQRRNRGGGGSVKQLASHIAGSAARRPGCVLRKLDLAHRGYLSRASAACAATSSFFFAASIVGELKSKFSTASTNPAG